jgi:protein required for attachment to host cells
MNTLVLIADATRARILTVESRPLNPSSPRALVEHASLINAAPRVPEHDRFSSPRSDAGGRAFGAVYTLDDGREDSAREADRAFASQVMQETARIARLREASTVILVAEPRMLGRLRARRDLLTNVEVMELPSDLAHHAPHDVLEHLEKASLLPPPHR